jgi:hypothetical protein
MRIYVASKSPSARFALVDGNVIEVCAGGSDPEGDAKSYAKSYVKGSDLAAWVYEVDLAAIVGYKISKEVVAIVPSKP